MMSLDKTSLLSKDNSTLTFEAKSGQSLLCNFLFASVSNWCVCIYKVVVPVRTAGCREDETPDSENQKQKAESYFWSTWIFQLKSRMRINIAKSDDLVQKIQ
jgi:hypothetical protein